MGPLKRQKNPDLFVFSLCVCVFLHVHIGFVQCLRTPEEDIPGIGVIGRCYGTESWSTTEAASAINC